ncbi:MAG: hypothetical protein A2015_02140 [Spirochaetes bacterium GWF1_31_7]|nr:MAG: hypothetical protein A2Y30_12005 [Spirochaetes bacterium GWE1_32_154]OHD44691.1 MAG: hypothetical protein A2Y29_05840 [Spirochaetes bacterium GWE2_31_10]OHD47062.1 MAG: hypothetical protein A2015_02140 [Spirochaetes bacterium GWF1_31_7]OHD74904.1 MAG: hypothetical protein A2355_00030 [Spirochaetes bacterium RIFOXYB1_FULL_32_8]
MAFITGFFIREFREPGVLAVDALTLTANLTDYIYYINEHFPDDNYSLNAASYLNQWADDGFLRKYYTAESDIPLFELTPAAIKALEWIAELEVKEFIGTESRLLKIFELLKDLVYKSSKDPEIRLKELHNEREKIDIEIKKIESGFIETLDPTQIKERYFELLDTSSRLLSDFRQVEYNFREVDRSIRVKLADETLSKGAVIDNFFSWQNDIWDSDQGRSFKGFWELILSQNKLDELDHLLKSVISMNEISFIKRDFQLEKLKYNLTEAGGKVNRTINALIEQLSRFVSAKQISENKRIIELIREIEAKAVKLKDNKVTDDKRFLEIDDKPRIDSFISRPLHIATPKVQLSLDEILEGNGEVSTDFIYEQLFVDRNELISNIEKMLSEFEQVRLSQVIERYPVTKGVSEIIEYYYIALNMLTGIIDETESEILYIFNYKEETDYHVTTPLILFCREKL